MNPSRTFHLVLGSLVVVSFLLLYLFDKVDYGFFLLIVMAIFLLLSRHLRRQS